MKQKQVRNEQCKAGEHTTINHLPLSGINQASWTVRSCGTSIKNHPNGKSTGKLSRMDCTARTACTKPAQHLPHP
eukprot:13851631-Ditylum_brightwellii.AAC.1